MIDHSDVSLEIRGALITNPHLTILNLWTPAHIDTMGNELADAAAKEATERDPDPNNFISLTSVRCLIHLQTLSSWDALWKATKVSNTLRYINKSPPSLIPIPLYSSSSLSRTRLRTGFSFFNAHRFKPGFVDSPACKACGTAFETRAYYLLECLAWELFRQPLHAASREAGFFGPLHLSPLLIHPKLLTSMGNFVEATGRFEQPNHPL
ncbi:hypothetical protein FB451DRAFT_1400262 [Mycena latifolia]|nr:hypothetical protein FB451DRAFT_1400262 [Mycena latifolia]